MATLCEEFNKLVNDLRSNIKNAKFAKLTEEQANEFRTHVTKCDTCFSLAGALVDDEEFEDRDLSGSEEEQQNAIKALSIFVYIAEREDAQEKTTRERMIREVDEVDCRDENTVRNFIASHPELAPQKFGISTERYSHAVFFLAADALGMLLGRIARNAFNDPSTCFLLEHDGDILHSDKDGGCISAPKETVRSEIARMIHPAQSESSELDIETAEKLIEWLFIAFCYRNEYIVFGYQGTPTNKLSSIRLTPTQKSRLENDPLDGWK